MLEGIDIVFLHIKNPEKTTKWYEEKLGLNKSFSTSDKSWQEFSMRTNQPSRFALDYSGPTPSKIEQQPIMISFRVSDIHKAVLELENKGIEFFSKSKINDVGPILVATFQDPEGNYLQLS